MTPVNRIFAVYEATQMNVSLVCKPNAILEGGICSQSGEVESGEVQAGGVVWLLQFLRTRDVVRLQLQVLLNSLERRAGYVEVCSANAGAELRVFQDVKEDIDAVAEGALCAGSPRTLSVVEGELPGDLVPDVFAGRARWCGDAEGLLELPSDDRVGEATLLAYEHKKTLLLGVARHDIDER